MMAQARTKLMALGAIAMLALLVAVLHFWVEQLRVEAQNDGRRARLASLAYDGLLVALLDAETGERGYLITLEDPYLAPYEQALEGVDESLAAAENAIEDPDTRATLESLVTQKLDEMALVVSLTASGRRDEALVVMRDDRGMRYMDEIRALLQVERERSEASITQALARRGQYATAGEVTTIGALALIAALVLVVWFAVRRDIQHMETQQDLIQSQAQQLAIKSEGLERLTETLEIHNTSLASANRDLALLGRERQQAIVDLERRNHDLDQFAYITSHDLKAPLRAISNLSSWIEQDLPADTEASTRENLALLQRRAARMDMLIDGILAYSRAGRGSKQVLTSKSLAELVGELRPLLDSQQSELVLDSGGELLCPSDQVEFGQVLTNLLSNAIKHGGPGKQVHITARQDADALEVSVRDEGPGIDPRYHARIFEIFQTLSSRDEVEGAGIGLAIVRKLVHGVGGTVRVESAEGQGATFHFRWPVSPAPVAPHPKETP